MPCYCSRLFYYVPLQWRVFVRGCVRLAGVELTGLVVIALVPCAIKAALRETLMLIRQETEADYPAIYELVKVAFQTAKVTDGDEQNFVNRLRAGGNYIPELALVAEDGGQLVGHIMLTRTHVDTENGPFPLLLLAPVAVVLERRNQQIGARLIEEAFRLAKEKGHKATIVVGDPAYYGRFGFKTSADFGIENTNGIPGQYVMARELAPAALSGIKGSLTFET